MLWPSYTDAELGAVFMCFKAVRDPAADRAALALFLPALSIPELTGLGASYSVREAKSCRPVSLDANRRAK